MIAERLGIAYDALGDAGGYDAELRLALRQFDRTASLFQSLAKVSSQLHRTFGNLAQTERNLARCFSAEGERLETAPSHRGATEEEKKDAAAFRDLVVEVGAARVQLAEHGELASATTGAMSDRATVVADKVVADVVLTGRSAGRCCRRCFPLSCMDCACSLGALRRLAGRNRVPIPSRVLPKRSH